ncbi:hypothetical protein MVEN_01027900 [Mycena venus]|uniref:ARM repeat-containing protein n=1 Tax=Mycena venus TaxID=2733690 RepID=A0A8H7D0E1_9AGAR|nr:hypothetical protein MVEN_01027900 [Mycena venus]
MQPSTRPESRPEHTSKPLMRWMYYRQVSEIIRKNRGTPLSNETLELYSTYFPWDFVSWSAKAAILSELADRSESEGDARAVLNSPIFPHIAQLLESPDFKTRSSSCRLLGKLVSHKSTRLAILKLEPFERLLLLLHDKHWEVILEAASAISELVRRLDGAQAIANAMTAAHVVILLRSTKWSLLEWLCLLLGQFVGSEATAPAILRLLGQPVGPEANVPTYLKLTAYGQLIFFHFRHGAACLREASYALFQIARWPDGAEAIIDAKVLDKVLDLLQSPSPNERKWACQLVAALADHEFAVNAMLHSIVCVRLLSLLRDQESWALLAATSALVQIARWPDGAQVIADEEGIMDVILILLQSPSSAVRECTCRLLGRLARHDRTAWAVSYLKSCVPLLKDEEPQVTESAMYILTQIARRLDGAKAIVDAQVLNQVLKLLEAPDPTHWKWPCTLVGRLASHGPTAPAILELNLSALLRSRCLSCEPETCASAIFALCAISEWPDGVEPLEKIHVDALLRELLAGRSLQAETRVQAYKILNNLARYRGIEVSKFSKLPNGVRIEL